MKGLAFTEGEYAALSAQVLYFGELVLEGVSDAYSHQPSVAEERALNSWLFGLHAALTRRQATARTFRAKPVAMDEANLRQQLESVAHELGGEEFPYPAPSGRWLQGLELATCGTRDTAPTLEAAYGMARVNLQRACERLILLRLLAAVYRVVGARGPDLPSNQEALHLLRMSLYQHITAARARLDRLGLLLGGEAARYCAALGYAELQRYSVVEMLELDNRSPFSYPASVRDGLLASIRAAGESLTVSEPRC